MSELHTCLFIIGFLFLSWDIKYNFCAENSTALTNSLLPQNGGGDLLDSVLL